MRCLRRAFLISMAVRALGESLSALWFALLRRQLTLAARRPVQVLNPMLFFAMVIVLFPLGLGPDTELLSEFAPGILWIVALLSTMLGAEALFRDDHADGTLEQLLLAPHSLYFLVTPHLLAHWLTSGVLLALLSPVFALMLGLPGKAVPLLMMSLALGSAVMVVLGAIGASLTVGLRRGGMLIVLLVTPFYVPVLIFGTAAVDAAVTGLSPGPYIALLGAFFFGALALGPLAVAAGLRISVDG